MSEIKLRAKRKNTDDWLLFGITELFDEVNDTLLDEPVEIDKEVFWASGKILAQRITSGPTITFDLDFRIYDDISKFGILDGDVGCLWLEEINNEFYGRPENMLKYSKLNWDFKWLENSLNVSFLYLKDENFKNEYCDLAIEFMKSSFGRIPKNLDKVSGEIIISSFPNSLVKIKLLLIILSDS